jgi:translation initiation factor IF-2
MVNVWVQARVEEELLQCGVQLERFGGDVQSVQISAVTGRGVPQLEEVLLAEAELNAVMGDPSGPVEAVVIESHVDRGLG